MQALQFFRLAEAHARLLCHEEVAVIDAVTAVQLLDSSMASASNLIHSMAPDNPTQDYLDTAEAILAGKI